MPATYFDPAGLARLGSMDLVAKQVVEGFLTGRHRSPYHGFSVEYLDHRSYTPGDDLRTMDWKMLARSDKYQIKLYEDETNLRAYILLDCSQSMAFKSGEIDKLSYGAYLAAALTYLLIKQNDAVGLVLFDKEVRQYIPPKAPSVTISPDPSIAGRSSVGRRDRRRFGVARSRRSDQASWLGDCDK